MENLKKYFSNKFLEKIRALGGVLPINDEKFYLVFKNDKAALIQYKGKDSITINKAVVTDYNNLSLETKEIIDENCNEGAVIWILKDLQNN